MGISSAIDNSAVARTVGIKTEFKDLRAGQILFLPQRVAVVGQGSTGVTYATTKQQITSASEAGSLYGFGSPIHLAVGQLLPVNGDGVGTIPVTVYPLVDDVSGVASESTITVSGTPTIAASYVVKVNNISSEPFVISVGDSNDAVATAMAAAINAVLGMPVTAAAALAVVTLTSKWAGASANDIYVEVDGSTAAGSIFAIVQATGGLVNPNIDGALAQVGEIWESMALNCLDVADTATLDKYNVFGEGRWTALTRKPMVVFTGNLATDVTSATAVSDLRKTDKVNGQLVAPGSHDLPFITAARQLARIVVVANNNPPTDYGSQDATGLTPGTDAEQWNYIQRDSAIKKGSSSIQVKDGVVNVSDTVTFYHPDGEPIPAYRYVVDIVKLQTIIYNIDLIFDQPEWDGAPLIPDDQPTVNPAARTPKAAKAAVASMVDSLALNAIISDPETAKKNIFAAINDQNPKRLDVVLTVQLSGNTNIISIDLNFGFFFGQPVILN